MLLNFCNIGIVSYTYSGEEELYYLPVLNCVPENIHNICNFQKFRIDNVGNNVVTLYYRDKQGRLVTQKTDITSACKENSAVMFCLCKTEQNGLELYVYCDYAHNGLFELDKEFVQNSGYKA